MANSSSVRGITQYAVLPASRSALILLFNMKGMDAIISLQCAVMWPVGDILPPTAVVGKSDSDGTEVQTIITGIS